MSLLQSILTWQGFVSLQKVHLFVRVWPPSPASTQGSSPQTMALHSCPSHLAHVFTADPGPASCLPQPSLRIISPIFVLSYLGESSVAPVTPSRVTVSASLTYLHSQSLKGRHHIKVQHSLPGTQYTVIALVTIANVFTSSTTGEALY